MARCWWKGQSYLGCQRQRGTEEQRRRVGRMTTAAPLQRQWRAGREVDCKSYRTRCRIAVAVVAVVVERPSSTPPQLQLHHCALFQLFVAVLLRPSLALWCANVSGIVTLLRRRNALGQNTAVHVISHMCHEQSEIECSRRRRRRRRARGVYYLLE